MEVFGTVYDNSTSVALPGAKVTVVDKSGEITDYYSNAVTDKQGAFDFKSDALDTGSYLRFDASGFTTVVIAPGLFLESNDVGLNKEATLPTAVVTAKLPSATNYGGAVPYVLGGIALLIVITMAVQHHKMGKVKTSVNWEKIVLGLGITAVVYFGVVRPLLIKLGVMKGMGADNVFNAGDIIGKTLIAAKAVPIYDDPGDSQKPTGTIAAGSTVGVVYSYLEADATKDRKGLWWMFQRPDGSYFYAPHQVGYFDINALEDAGVLTTAQATALKDAASKPLWQQEIEKYIPWVIGGALALGVVKVALNKVL